MPIYEYRCGKCGHEFEALVRGATTPACESCGSLDLERLLSLPHVKSAITTERAMRAAKQRDQRQAVERTDAQRRYEQSHDSD